MTAFCSICLVTFPCFVQIQDTFMEKIMKLVWFKITLLATEKKKFQQQPMSYLKLNMPQPLNFTDLAD